MKFKSPVYTQASGSIGGLTYGHTRGVMYTRGRGVPTNPNTGSQQLARSALSSMSSQWATLSTSDQDGWTAYAAGTPLTNALGDPLTLTGQQMFVRCNTPRLRNGKALVTTPPLTLGVPTFTPMVPTITAAVPGDISLAFTATDDWATEVGGYAFVQSGPAISPGRRYFKGPFFGVGSIAGALVAPTSPATFQMENDANTPPTEYQADIGQLVFLRIVVSRADGRLSYEQIVSTIVVS